MRKLIVIFYQLVLSVATENPLRDKFHISSCGNARGHPEMTIVGPEYILNGKISGQTKTIEKIINGDQLILTTNDKCEFKFL